MRIVIPTAGRPHSLTAVLGYYARFYPDADIVVADGSAPAVQERNRQTVADSGLAADHRGFDPDVPVFERLLRVVNDLDDDYLVLGADDNYPILETLEVARRRLEERPTAVCAGGHLVHLDVVGPDQASAHLDPVRHLNADDPVQRMRTFGALPFPTAYGVARRAHVQARLEFLREWYLPSFYALGVGLFDVAHGQYVAVPELGFVCTSNFVDDVREPEEPLACLRSADQVLAMNDLVLEWLSRVPGFDEDEARQVLTRAIGRRVADLSGAPPHQVVGFADQAPFKTPIVDGARKKFRDLFTAGTPERERYAERLSFIGERLHESVTSMGNYAEAGAR